MILTLCVVAFTFLMIVKKWKTNRKVYLKVIVLIEVAAVLWEGIFFINNTLFFDNRIRKLESGESGRKEKLEVRSRGFSEEYELEVPKRSLSTEEIEALFEKAYKEIRKSYLGENEEESHVTHDLVLRESYVDGLVSANWKADSECISSTGKVLNHRIKHKKHVLLTVTLRCKGEEVIESVPIIVCPLDLKTHEGKQKAIEYELEELLQKKDTKKYFELPEMLGKVRLKWTRKNDYKGFIVSVMGLIILVLLPFVELEKTLREQKYREQIYKEDYPKILQKLVMFVECGISVRKSFSLIRDSYLRRGKKDFRYGFEVISKAAKRLENGESELEVYRRIGTENISRDFKKLSYLLCQNLKGGNEALISVLEHEVGMAIERERIDQKAKGELISTKLVVPLMIMLFVVMLILVVPGIWGISI